MHFFQYKNGNLHCEELNLKEIVDKFSTPLYVYSRRTLIRHLNVLKEAFSEISPLICFSMKANSSLAICKLLINQGAGLDIVSGGELYKALKIGADPGKIVYAGVGKTEEEIKFALSKNIFLFNVESIPELKLINKVAKVMDRKQKVLIRINPDVTVDTHKYIATGKDLAKFGIDFSTCQTIVAFWNDYTNLELSGVHIHIGSQITESEPFKEAINKAGDFIEKIREQGIKVEYLDIGGGLGIVYKDEKPQTAQQFADAIIDLIKQLKVKIIMEPGRFIAGNSGVLLTKVLYLKRTPTKNFLVVDAGMNDLLRPSFYNAYHEVLSLKEHRSSPRVKVDIVGPICESGDFLAKNREVPVPVLSSGNVLSVMGAGAYGYSMASNYNSRPRAAEVIVKDDEVFLIRERETQEDLISNEKIPDEIL